MTKKLIFICIKMFLCSVFTKELPRPNWWRRRTALQRCRTLESVFACIAVVWLAGGLAEAFDPGAFCLEKECIHSASAALKKIKPTINPCDDFYEYACGSYLDTTPIPEDKGWVDTYTEEGDKLREQLKAILTKQRPESDPRHYRLPNAFFQACMNKELIETLDTKPIQEIAEKLGGWPVIVGKRWNRDGSWNWQETIKKSRRLGFSIDSILKVSVDVNLRNNTQRFIQLDQPSLGLNRAFLVNGINDSTVVKYYNYMVKLAELFGAKPEKARKELEKSLKFEMHLANISMSSAQRHNYTEMYNLRTIKQLQKAYPSVQWLDLFNAILPEDLQVDENEVINLATPSYFKGLDRLLKRTNKSVIANHMMWRAYDYAVDYLPERFRKVKMQFKTALTGEQEPAVRSVECLDVVTKRFSVSVGSQYVQKHFKQDSRTVAMEMVTNIQNAFKKILEEAEWMDNTTKQKAKNKVDSIHTRIGYPDELLNETILEEYYRGLNFTDPGNYLRSFLELNIFDVDNTFKELRLPVKRTGWTTFTRPAFIFAYYGDSENSITFPAAILQGQLFNGDRLKGINYGAIGSFIGHEISHGFDDIGRQFDSIGNLVNWWENVTTENAYLERAKCIIEQYSNYTNEQVGLTLNGKTTQSENIADNAGVKVAYLAYTDWLDKNGDELKLPGFHNYTSQQLFWLSAAQLWCAKYTDEGLKTFITSRTHSPSQYRVLGPFTNMEEFSSDFNCAQGTPMNPVKKCGVW